MSKSKYVSFLSNLIIFLFTSRHVVSVDNYPDFLNNRFQSNYKQLSNLHKHLFKDNEYNNEILPIINGNPVNVTLDLYLIEITNFDSVSQSLTGTFWLTQIWQDDRLKWDPKDYQNATDLRVAATTVWRPDITLYNPSDGMHYPGEAEHQVMALVLHTGVVRWSPIVSYSVTCPVELRYFPFDVQVCNLKFGSWIHSTQLIYLSIKDKVNTQYFKNAEEEGRQNEKVTKNNAWILHSTKAHENIETYLDVGYQDVKYFLILQRNSTQYLWNLIYTCMILCFLCIFSFCVPVDSGERLSLSLSILVSLSVYQLLASDMIPIGTKSTPIITIFIFGLVLLVAFSIFISMLNCRIHLTKIIRPPPDLIFNFVVNYSGRLFYVRSTYHYKNYVKAKKLYEIQKRSKANKSNSSSDPLASTLNGSANDSATTPTSRIKLSLKEITQKVQEKVKEDPDQDYKLDSYEKLCDTKWSVLAVALDRVSMFLYILAFVGLTITIYIFRYSNDRQVKDIEEDIETVLRFL